MMAKIDTLHRQNLMWSSQNPFLADYSPENVAVYAMAETTSLYQSPFFLGNKQDPQLF
jgi:hypothetical protein